MSIATSISHSSPSWQRSLVESITDPAELFELLALDKKFLPAAQLACKEFALRVPRGFAAKMEIGNIHDPLLNQILPLAEELTIIPGYYKNPLQEDQFNQQSGLLHKYAGRVLLTVAGACAVNCRYCFRRHFPYRENNPGKTGWQPVIEYIAATPSINEVIYSGGDPLLATDEHLAYLTRQLAAIPHLKRLRIHTRLPIVLPERINQELLAWLASERWQSIVVLHSNHPREVDEEVANAVKQLTKAGVTVFNQAVLLKGINDNAATQIALSYALFEAGILPYYLHMLDKVQGAAHFDVEQSVAQQLWSEMAQQLPGYLLPRLVRENPGEKAKTPIPIVEV